MPPRLTISLDVPIPFSYRRGMTNAPDNARPDIRVVGRDHLIHVIVRVLERTAQQSRRPMPTLQQYQLAEQIAEDVDQFGWQMVRQHGHDGQEPL